MPQYACSFDNDTSSDAAAAAVALRTPRWMTDEFASAAAAGANASVTSKKGAAAASKAAAPCVRWGVYIPGSRASWEAEADGVASLARLEAMFGRGGVRWLSGNSASMARTSLSARYALLLPPFGKRGNALSDAFLSGALVLAVHAHRYINNQVLRLNVHSTTFTSLSDMVDAVGRFEAKRALRQQALQVQATIAQAVHFDRPLAEITQLIARKQRAFPKPRPTGTG
jgi:hypothetical protein